MMQLLLLLICILPIAIRGDSPADRLGVFLYNTDDSNVTDPVTTIDRYLAPYTPVDIYIVCPKDKKAAWTQRIRDFRLKSTKVTVKTLEETGHGAEEAGRDAARHHYANPKFHMGYRLMGDWRLWYQQHYARSLGYRYILQIDSNSGLSGPIAYDIVRAFTRNNTQMACRVLSDEREFVVWGLAELMRFFILTEDFLPEGRLYQYCTPNSIAGLHSFTGKRRAAEQRGMEERQLELAKANGVPAEAGWRPVVPYGNFVILDLELWLSPPVQRFVKLCRVSGASMRFRWNEQSVYAAIWQMFVPDSRFALMDFPYFHGSARW